ncbi:hypothetical protein BDV59DRAFT_203237 [Aspergillus ambiguus]|uniref:uncharacterized protein n=1 Tax=Aspergillus ambiguus TaxID=176160 RepID=UPI003CCD584B
MPYNDPITSTDEPSPSPPRPLRDVHDHLKAVAAAESILAYGSLHRPHRPTTIACCIRNPDQLLCRLPRDLRASGIEPRQSNQMRVLTSIFRPSYTRPPPHYEALRDAVSRSQRPSGRGNPRNESVFIAASLYDRDGELAGGAWGSAVLAQVDLLGEANVFLSIYDTPGVVIMELEMINAGTIGLTGNLFHVEENWEDGRPQGSLTRTYKGHEACETLGPKEESPDP